MIPGEIIVQAETLVSTLKNRSVKFSGSKPVGGGCINKSICLETVEEKYFLKWNDASAYPGMFESEAKGLNLLREARAIKIPQFIGCGTAGPHAFILMEWLETGTQKRSFWSDFGKNLATLHGLTQEFYGLDHANYIGSLPQRNTMHGSWDEFYFLERLEPQVKLAVDSGRLTRLQISHVGNLKRRLPEILPKEIPALIHGDLWNGNFLVDSEGNAALVDPAVYYGHREMDLAMARLFGGFDPEFYRSYEEEFPLETGFDARIEIHQLYPLLVHVNLFGGGYIQQVEQILRKY